MSDNYGICAVGTKGFTAPWQLAGFEAHTASGSGDAAEFIRKQDTQGKLFILDEELVDRVSVVEELEEAGANIMILKGWGRSQMAGRKITSASVKAIGAKIF